MVTGDALSGDDVTIYIEAADTDSGVDGAGLTNSYQFEVTSFDIGGGSKDIESIAVFGGGFINKNKPQEQIEVSMDVILRHGSDVDKWDALWYSVDGTTKKLVFTDPKAIIIENNDGTNFYWNAWNNATITNFDKEFSAEDEWRGTISFKLSAATATGISNIQFGKTDLFTGTDILKWNP